MVQQDFTFRSISSEANCTSIYKGHCLYWVCENDWTNNLLHHSVLTRWTLPYSGSSYFESGNCRGGFLQVAWLAVIHCISDPQTDLDLALRQQIPGDALLCLPEFYLFTMERYVRVADSIFGSWMKRDVSRILIGGQWAQAASLPLNAQWSS